MARKRGNGEGSIFYNEKTGKWLGQYVVGYKADGKVKRKTVYGNTRKDVSTKIANQLKDIRDNTYIEDTNITLGELLEEIVQDKFNSNLVSKRTYGRDLGTLRVIKRSPIYTTPIQKISIRQLVTFFNSQTHYSNSYIRKIYSLVNKAFAKAYKRKYINENPMLDKEDVPRPKSSKCDKEVEAFTVEGQRKLVEILETEERTHPYKNIILLSLYTGMRIGEILALNRYKDIDLEHGFINIRVTLTRDEHENVIMGNTTKTYASKRKIAITPIVKHVLDSALRYWVPNPMELLFYDYPNNSLVHPGEVTSYIKRICKKYRIDKGWDVNFHMLRHTFATRCIESGMSAKVLQKKLGHKKIDTTLDTYTSVFAQFENQQDDLYTNYLAEQDLLINL